MCALCMLADEAPEARGNPGAPSEHMDRWVVGRGANHGNCWSRAESGFVMHGVGRQLQPPPKHLRPLGGGPRCSVRLRLLVRQVAVDVCSSRPAVWCTRMSASQRKSACCANAWSR